jgi:hypothetical protein
MYRTLQSCCVVELGSESDKELQTRNYLEDRLQIRILPTKSHKLKKNLECNCFGLLQDLLPLKAEITVQQSIRAIFLWHLDSHVQGHDPDSYPDPDPDP